MTKTVDIVPLTDDQILEIVKQYFPWKTESVMYDLLTHERSVPLFPQATYDVPSYRAEKFVRAVENQIRENLAAADEIIPADIKSPGTFDQGIAAAVAFLREQAREASRMSAFNGGIMETLSVYLDEIADIILTTKHNTSVESQ